MKTLFEELFFWICKNGFCSAGGVILHEKKFCKTRSSPNMSKNALLSASGWNPKLHNYHPCLLKWPNQRPDQTWCVQVTKSDTLICLEFGTLLQNWHKLEFTHESIIGIFNAQNEKFWTFTGYPVKLSALQFCYFLGFQSTYRRTSGHFSIAQEMRISKLTLLSFLILCEKLI